MTRLWLILILFLGLVRPLHAHDPQLSGIRIVIGQGRTVVSVTTHRSQLNAAEGASLDAVGIELAFRRRVRLRFSGHDFVPVRTELLRDDTNDLLTWQATLPEEVHDPEVLARLYPADPGSRTVLVLVQQGQVVQETLLDAANPAFVAATPTAPGAVLLRFLRTGVLHIFGGPDHVCFVLGLLLLGGNLKTLLRIVTAFTLAHSLTLSLAATGTYCPSPRYIEPLIALSIVAVAVENLRALSGTTPAASRDLRPWFAFGFGLIHGFGFAGALAEQALPTSALGLALTAFNGGVELGQALIVLAVAPALAGLAQHKPAFHRRLIAVVSVGIGIAGLFWLYTRLFTA